MRALTLLAVLVLASFTDAIAQERPLPTPGHWVRITSLQFGLSHTHARFEGVRHDTLRAVADSVLRVPLAAVTRFEVSRGRSALPVVLGAVAGAVGGTAVGIVLAEGCGFFDPGCTSADQVGPVILGAAIGALAGAALGVALRTERWEELPLDRLRVSVGPTRSGFGIGARIAFSHLRQVLYCFSANALLTRGPED